VKDWSLRTRVVLAGLCVTATVLVIACLAVLVALRAMLLADLEGVLVDRHAVATSLLEGASAAEAVAVLEEQGLRARVQSAGGESTNIGPSPTRIRPFLGTPGPLAVGTLSAPPIPLRDGGTATMLISRDGVDRLVGRLGLFAIGVIAFAVVLAYGLFVRVTRSALAPLEEATTLARGIAAGERGQRLHPTRRDTEIGQLAAAIDTMLDALDASAAAERATRIRDRDFLADAAHQLRTPIAGVRACAEALQRGVPSASRERLLANLVAETSKAGRIIGDLLRMERLDRGHDALAPEATDVAVLCRQEVERLAVTRPDLVVDVECEPGTRAVAWAPALAVRDALGNVLDNAARHAHGTVTLRIDASDGVVTIRVRDDGPGPAQPERMFERFASLDAHGGTGLGLPIARALVAGAGGALVWTGDSFLFRLPSQDPTEASPGR
jgi:signal transduction histidine kinase